MLFQFVFKGSEMSLNDKNFFGQLTIFFSIPHYHEILCPHFQILPKIDFLLLGSFFYTQAFHSNSWVDQINTIATATAATMPRANLLDNITSWQTPDFK